ncbi:hypothetical protein PR048_021765 [Dryococelus australis]|uniref:Uncharacterized protein n=1 Tax=Dryococelus australis TaxID=614101 RepID=A0ABQ9GZC8_9NEOP|nr:hypothetical protein PR048_021765 [Dryococelus australis]
MNHGRAHSARTAVARVSRGESRGTRPLLDARHAPSEAPVYKLSRRSPRIGAHRVNQRQRVAFRATGRSRNLTPVPSSQIDQFKTRFHSRDRAMNSMAGYRGRSSWEVHLGQRHVENDAFRRSVLHSYRRHMVQPGLIPWLVDLKNAHFVVNGLYRGFPLTGVWLCKTRLRQLAVLISAQVRWRVQPGILLKTRSLPSGRDCIVARLLTPPLTTGILGKPGSIPWIFACENRVRRYRWSAGFLGDLPLPLPLHSGAAPYSHHFTFIGSQDIDIKSCPILSAPLHFYYIISTLSFELPSELQMSVLPTEQVDLVCVAASGIRYEIRSGNTGGVFSLDQVTGVLRVSGKLDYETHNKTYRYPAGSLPDFRMWESCPTMPLVGRFSRGSPYPPPFHSRADPYSSRFTLIGVAVSERLACSVKANRVELPMQLVQANRRFIVMWYSERHKFRECDNFRLEVPKIEKRERERERDRERNFRLREIDPVRAIPRSVCHLFRVSIQPVEKNSAILSPCPIGTTLMSSECSRLHRLENGVRLCISPTRLKLGLVIIIGACIAAELGYSAMAAIVAMCTPRKKKRLDGQA